MTNLYGIFNWMMGSKKLKEGTFRECGREKNSMKSVKRRLNKLVTIIKHDSQILAIFLFGSAVRDERYEDSDVDICLLMNEDSHTSMEFFQKRMSYLKLFNMDIQIFQQLPLYIKIRIIKEGKILFCRNEDRLYEILFRTIQEFSDFEHIYRDYLKEVASVR